MNVVKQEIDKLNAILKVQVSKSDYEGNVEKALKDARKNIQMPGFRKGMVPASLVKKMYGKHTQLQEINKLVTDGLYDYIKEQSILLLGEPLPNEDQQSKIDWESQGDFEFWYDIAVQPEVSVALSNKVKAAYFAIDIDKEFLDKQVDAMTSQFGSNEEADSVVNDELISATFTQVDDKGVVVENGYVKENAMLLLKVIDEAERKPFIGLKRGQSLIFTPMKSIKHEYEVVSMLGVKHEDSELINSAYKVDINDIKRFVKADVGQDLFDKVFGEGEVKNEQEFRDKIKERMQVRFSVNSDYKFFSDFKKQLMDSTSVELPEAFLKRWLIAANKEKNISPDEIEKDLPHFFIDLKWQLIKGHFIKEQNITVSQDEFKVAAREFARMQFQQFGYYNPSDEDLDRWAVEISKNQEEAKRIYDIETDKKLITYFKSVVKLDQKNVSLEEFNKMMEKEEN